MANDHSKRTLTLAEKKQILLDLLDGLRKAPPSPSINDLREDNELSTISVESREVLAALDPDLDFSNVYICLRCCDLRGDWKSQEEVFHQRCWCERDSLPDPEETWFGFEFNQLCELCRCCGAELASSGFDSSVWFCRECRDRVESVNGDAGRRVIPLCRSEGEDTRLSDWRTRIVRENVQALGLNSGGELKIETFLQAVYQHATNKQVAFTDLCTFLSSESQA
jgi:hypothetical protein